MTHPQEPVGTPRSTTGHVRWRYGLLLAAPGLALAAVGITHPENLTYDSAEHWWVMHLVLLPLFPLLGLALAGLVRRRNDAVGWSVRLLAFVFAVFYGALDVLAGIGAGFVTDRGGADPQAGSPMAVRSLFAIGNDLAEVGVLALLVACVVVAGDHVRRHRLAAAAPAVLLVAASVSFLDSHIYRWVGVLTVALIGLATGWLGALGSPSADPRARSTGMDATAESVASPPTATGARADRPSVA